MGFLTNVSFHDAKLVKILKGEKYGKEYLSFLVNFKTAESAPASDTLYEIRFWNGKFVWEPN